MNGCRKWRGPIRRQYPESLSFRYKPESYYSCKPQDCVVLSLLASWRLSFPHVLFKGSDLTFDHKHTGSSCI